MKSFDILTGELVDLMGKVHPEMSREDVGRYVIGLMSGIGHVLLSLQESAGVVPAAPVGSPAGRSQTTDGVVCAGDLVWHRAHHCWVTPPASLVGQGRASVAGVAITSAQLVFEKVREKLGDQWNLQLEHADGSITLSCGEQEMKAVYTDGVLTTSIRSV